MSRTSLDLANTSECQSLINKFNIFVHNFENSAENNKKLVENLFVLVNKLPAFKTRKTQLKSPYDKSEILTDYSLLEVKLFCDQIQNGIICELALALSLKKTQIWHQLGELQKKMMAGKSGKIFQSVQLIPGFSHPKTTAFSNLKSFFFLQILVFINKRRDMLDYR